MNKCYISPFNITHPNTDFLFANIKLYLQSKLEIT